MHRKLQKLKGGIGMNSSQLLGIASKVYNAKETGKMK
jgi:hypothetical protein